MVLVPDPTEPPGAGGTANPGWYRDPWGRSAWRWWDGWQWTGWISPPGGVNSAVLRTATAGAGSPGGPTPVAAPATAGPRNRRRLLVELAIVLAIFPLPEALNAWVDLVDALLGRGGGQRLPTLFGGHAGLGFWFLMIELLLPLAGGALVLYLLSLPGGDGGPAAIGLDRRNPRGDAALVLPVFGLCFFLAQLLVAAALAAAHVKGVNPSFGHFPAYYQVLDVTNGVVSAVVEEIVVLGYLVRRLEQLGTRPAVVIVLAVLLRGSYHVYYGWGVVPILGWALASVLVYRRFRRLAPFIFVHACWDIGAILVAFHGAGVYAVEAVLLLPASIAAFAAWRRFIAPPPPVAQAAWPP